MHLLKKTQTETLNELTPREHEVITKLYEGKTYEEISRELGVGIDTVRKHATNLYAKLDVRNKMQAARKYFG